MKLTCRKCESQNLEVLHDDYHGEYTALTYICTDCNTKQTNYHDAIFNFFNPIPPKISQEKVT